MGNAGADPRPQEAKFGSLAVTSRRHAIIQASRPRVLSSEPNLPSYYPNMLSPQKSPPIGHGRVARGVHASQTIYMAMSIQANQVPLIFDILAGVSSWLTLAGYLVLPNTFTSLGRSNGLNSTASGKAVQNAVQNVPLLPAAAVLCCIGLAGSCWLWWRKRSNYVWLISRIFL